MVLLVNFAIGTSCGFTGVGEDRWAWRLPTTAISYRRYQPPQILRVCSRLSAGRRESVTKKKLISVGLGEPYLCKGER